jgi:protein TonB
MSLAVDLPGLGDGHLRALWARHNRIFAITLLASAAMHVAAIAIAPGFRRFDQSAPPPLEVALVRPPMPEPMKPPPRALPKPPPKPLSRPVQEEARRKPAPAQAPEQRQLLALPDPGPSAPSAFSVPQTSVEPAPSAPEPKPAVAAAPPPTREAVPSTPANFNAAYLRNAPPRYPLIARRNGVEGTVRLRVFVSRDGRPTQVQLDQSSGSAALDNAALEAVRNWQFVPARRGQEAIESWVLVPVVFKLEGVS